MSEDENETRKTGGGCLVIAVFLIPILYVLSPVPVSLLLYLMPEELHGYFIPILEVVYMPLQWAYDNVDWVEAFYDWQSEFLGL